jgi:hypothetical protein
MGQLHGAFNFSWRRTDGAVKCAIPLRTQDTCLVGGHRKDWAFPAFFEVFRLDLNSLVELYFLKLSRRDSSSQEGESSS